MRGFRRRGSGHRGKIAVSGSPIGRQRRHCRRQRQQGRLVRRDRTERDDARAPQVFSLGRGRLQVRSLAVRDGLVVTEGVGDRRGGGGGGHGGHSLALSHV